MSCIHRAEGPDRRPAVIAGLFALALGLPGVAFAATQASRLDAVQVTASRVEKPVAEALASVTVLDREDIEASQAPDLIDLLGRQAGVDIARTGGPGSGSALFLRGGNSTHALVLIDGIRVASTGQGVFDFAHLPLERIERIEIVRGPRAALWGSDAIGGVVQVFTRDPEGASARLAGGSYGRASASVDWGVGDGDRGFGIGIGGERLHGFSATNADAVFSHDPDDDGYRNRNLSLQGATTLGTQRLAFRGIATRGDLQFDQGTTASRNSSGGITLDGGLGARWHHQLTVGHAREDLDTRGAFGNAFRSRRSSVDWLNRVAIGADGHLVAGINWQREAGRSATVAGGPLFSGERTGRAVFAGYGGRFGAHVLDASLRHDDSSQYGSARTGSAAWGWDASERLQLRLSWGQGFRAPNFNELYYPDSGYGFAGNPDLRPERSASWEAGLEFRPADGHRAGLSVYRTRVHDLIAFAAPVTNNAINIERARLDGVELEYRFTRAAWTAGGNATWQDARDASSGDALLRRAPRKAHADVGYRFDSGFELALDADHVSAREDFGATLDAFTLLHLRLAWQLSPAWRLQARIENLGDRDYAWVHGYNTPGRSGLFSIVWSTPR